MLSEVFRIDNTAEIRNKALEQDFIIRILDRIGIVSKEGRRKWQNEIEDEEELSLKK